MCEKRSFVNFVGKSKNLGKTSNFNVSEYFFSENRKYGNFWMFFLLGNTAKFAKKAVFNNLRLFSYFLGGLVICYVVI